ncbi:hypothetical protein Tco_1362833, partial [Tanacetum coccineum]
PESQAVNECLTPTEASNDPESSKYSESESLTLLPPLKNLQGASPSSESPLEHPDKKRNLNTSAKLAQAKPSKYSGEADMFKDTSGPESPEEL